MTREDPGLARAERIVTLAADYLDRYPQQQALMDEPILRDALRAVQNPILREVRPRSSQSLVRALVRSMLPPISGTVGEYARRLRARAAHE
ncbi:hypothetical protein GCM10009601_51440 [Streptomyces thermospinosisporus]|uniref:Uncharacterized protein n=1 Tax=Streptomyces thermospinosisporus TaxID=161482 RepID=A0ABP4JVG1_9ACTN